MEFLRRFECVKRLARSVLHLEIQDAHTTLYTEQQKVNYWHREFLKADDRHTEQTKRVVEVNEWMSGWANPSVNAFVRDYLIQGPMGPSANTHGVHPARKWGITDFFGREEHSGNML